MGGGGGVSTPPPTEEEVALQQEQIKLLREQGDLLRQQRREQDLLAPILFQQSGLIPQTDDDGNIIGFEEDPDSVAVKLRDLQLQTFEQLEADLNDPIKKEIEQSFNERTLAALRGELPINPQLLRELDEQEVTLRETLRKNVGPGFETSTPGQDALGDFFQRKEELLENARRGDLTLGEQLGVAREQANDANLLNSLNAVFGIDSSVDQLINRSSVVSGRSGTLAQLFGNASQSAVQAQQGFQSSRELLQRGRIASSQATVANNQAIIGGAATGVGVAAGVAIAI